MAELKEGWQRVHGRLKSRFLGFVVLSSFERLRKPPLRTLVLFCAIRDSA